MSVSSFQFPDAPAQRQILREQILAVTDDSFESLTLAVFRYQAVNNPVYREYITHLGVKTDRITSVRQIPFMPIAFFRQHDVVSGALTPAVTFASSGTTGSQTSRHLVADADLYDAVSRRIFEGIYGPLENIHVLALLPSYLERNNSSLVYMVQRFMAVSRRSQCDGSRSDYDPAQTADQSGFYLTDFDALTDKLHQLTEETDRHSTPPTILLMGVTFGLLDWAESGRDLTFLGRYPRLVVMETGGMKGRRKELLREEVHTILQQRLGVPSIHSEYGMTELLSQAYSPGEGIFYPGPTMRVLLRDINDPFDILPSALIPTGERRTGGINVIDLANLDSCAFIETQDLGQYVTEPSPARPSLTRPDPLPAGQATAFRVIGRFDNSDVRGCNLMVL